MAQDTVVNPQARGFDPDSRYSKFGVLNSATRKLDDNAIALADEERPAKRVRMIEAFVATKSMDTDELRGTLPPHPLGIKPSGNALTATSNLKTSAGSFSKLPDELIIHLLECLQSHELRRLGYTCKALYAFATSDDLWKTILVE